MKSHLPLLNKDEFVHIYLAAYNTCLIRNKYNRLSILEWKQIKEIADEIVKNYDEWRDESIIWLREENHR